MTRIIAVANQKGGTGKTTTTVNLVAGLARQHNQRVLLVDLDPQANATSVFFGPEYIAGPEPGLTVYELLLGKAEATQTLRSADLAGSSRNNLPAATIDLLPAHINLAAAEQELISVFQRETRLKNALQSAVENYDFVVIDCPPNLGMLTINGLMMATEVLIPVEPGVFPLIGLGLLQQTIGTVQQANPNLRVMGVLPVRYNRTNLASGTIEELTNAFGELVFPAIPERVVIGEAHAQRQDIFLYAASSDGAAAYETLVSEVMKRGEIEQEQES